MMEQREMLIELLDKLDVYDDWLNNEAIADLLISNGVVVLPFKVGDAVRSAIPFTDGKIREGYISVFLVDEDGVYSFYASFGVEPISAEFLIDEIGKTVFFTKEEAEKALEKRKGGEE